MEHYAYFCQKVLPGSMSVPNLREKILEKQSEEESTLQLTILRKVSELNVILGDKRPSDLFKDQTCKSLYNTILNLQISQHFASAGWKVIAFPSLIPMADRILIFTAGIFHTKNSPLFNEWSLNQKCHADTNLSPNFVNVEQQTPRKPRGLGQYPTHRFDLSDDWSNPESLEDQVHNEIVEPVPKPNQPQMPIQDARDVTNTLEKDRTLESFQESIDMSFITLKPKLNLSKKDKIDILNGTSSKHSTPIRKSPSQFRPKLGSTLKKQTQNTINKSQNRTINRPKTRQNNFLAKIMSKWLQNQIVSLANDLQSDQ